MVHPIKPARTVPSAGSGHPVHPPRAQNVQLTSSPKFDWAPGGLGPPGRGIQYSRAGSGIFRGRHRTGNSEARTLTAEGRTNQQAKENSSGAVKSAETSTDAEKIAAKITELDASLNKIANLVHIHPTYLGKMARGVVPVSPERLEQILSLDKATVDRAPEPFSTTPMAWPETIRAGKSLETLRRSIGDAGPVAKALGISSSHLSNLEKGKASVDTIERFKSQLLKRGFPVRDDETISDTEAARQAAAGLLFEFRTTRGFPLEVAAHLFGMTQQRYILLEGGKMPVSWIRSLAMRMEGMPNFRDYLIEQGEKDYGPI